MEIQVGDTVIIKGVVQSLGQSDLGFIYIHHPAGDNHNTLGIHKSYISEVIPKPWIPEVGELVKWPGAGHIFYEFRGQVDDRAIVKSPTGLYYLTPLSYLKQKAV